MNKHVESNERFQQLSHRVNFFRCLCKFQILSKYDKRKRAKKLETAQQDWL